MTADMMEAIQPGDSTMYYVGRGAGGEWWWGAVTRGTDNPNHYRVAYWFTLSQLRNLPIFLEATYE